MFVQYPMPLRAGDKTCKISISARLSAKPDAFCGMRALLIATPTSIATPAKPGAAQLAFALEQRLGTDHNKKHHAHA